VAPEAPRGLHPGGGAGPPGGAAVRAPRVQQDADGEVRVGPLLCRFVFYWGEERLPLCGHNVSRGGGRGLGVCFCSVKEVAHGKGRKF
jgi:hypothetical protein